MRVPLLILAIILTAVGPAASQPMSLLPAGSRVRLEARTDGTNGLPRGGWVIGTVVDAGRDSLRIRFSHLDSVSTLAWTTIERLEVSRQVTSRAERMREGAETGAMVGAAAGFFVGVLTEADDGLWGAAVYMADGMAYGAIAGAALGAAAPESQRERWERVWPVVASRAARPLKRYASFRATPTFARP